MRTPDKCYEDFWGRNNGSVASEYDIKLVIGYAQNEAYNEAMNDLFHAMCKYGTHFNIVDVENEREKLLKP